MCGIIAVLRRPSGAPGPSAAEVESLLERSDRIGVEPAAAGLAESLAELASTLEASDRALRGPTGYRTLADAPDLGRRVLAVTQRIDARLDALEQHLDGDAHGLPAARLEALNAGIVRVRDATWALRCDRLRTCEAITDLAQGATGAAALEAFWAIQIALSALDRLEVRGRDSAGLQVLVHGLAFDELEPACAAELDARSADRLFRNRSVRRVPEGLAFVYKRAAEIGELGDNVAALRAAIRSDDLLRRALAGDVRVTVIGHTRWASVGIISEANAHPLNQEELPGDADAGAAEHYVGAALNGDVDNHLELVQAHGLRLGAEITTDAKVIPALIARRIAAGQEPLEAFRAAVAEFEGSVAIAAGVADAPDELFLALRGSGQALYVGCTDEAFVVASEPYGVVEECPHYLRLDGETPADPEQPVTSRGQIVRLRRALAGTVRGIDRLAYDATPLPVSERELKHSEITTRDVDRGAYPHFLLKEISEAPRSFRKTLRGKIVEAHGRLCVRLGDSVLPPAVRERLATGAVRRVVVIGQGTAAVAGQGVALALEDALRESPISVAAMPATELSGFGMRPDMSDTLVIAISQSGTTTDTNRTVDLVRARGALVIAIVNRRGSDLTDKADGVLYTSDGRDVEMSVASTKAFYAQIAAGFLLALAIGEAAGHADPERAHELLVALRALPAAMTTMVRRRPEIAAAAGRATQRRYWALVGNGPNRIAAEEVRIKLSELCYKSIACDATEDKKHIDLSSEPLILVCAAGMRGSTAVDVAKEVAIYKAHKAVPIVIADDGETLFDGASAVIAVPRVHPSLAFVLSAVAGHLFGYECALAIDALARPLRELRSAIEQAVHEQRDAEALLLELRPTLVHALSRYSEDLAAGRLDGTLEASTATRLMSLLRYATGLARLDTYRLEHGETGTPSTVVEALTAALTRAIEELTRPVDAIKHQAKTVTVGISRSDESLLNELLPRELLATGAPRDRIGYADLRTLAALGPAVAAVTGFSRYAIDGERIRQVAAGGAARGLASRTATDPTLRGTKHQVARERRLLVAKGRHDGRTCVLVPEVDGDRTVGMTLLHVELRDVLRENEARSVLGAYRNRLQLLTEAVMETEKTFRGDLLEAVSVERLLTEPVHDLAESWREVGIRATEH